MYGCMDLWMCWVYVLSVFMFVVAGGVVGHTPFSNRKWSCLSQATDPIVDTALKDGKPFAVVPTHTTHFPVTLPTLQ